MCSYLSLSLIIYFVYIGLHSYNLPTQKNDAPQNLAVDFKQVYRSNNNCSKLTSAKQTTSSISKMNRNCCYNVPARVVLYFLSWSGFMVSFMMRNDVSCITNYVNIYFSYHHNQHNFMYNVCCLIYADCVYVDFQLINLYLFLDKFCTRCHGKVK